MMGLFSDNKPAFTEKNVSDQYGKVFIVTGSTSGIGESLAGILYSKNAKVYIAARSAEKARLSMRKLRSDHPTSTGSLVFLHLDLNDLSTIKTSAHEFLQQETKLNVLFNNAGVMIPPQGSKTKQGHELQLGTNTIAHFLLTELLTPTLKETAKTEPAGDVRVVWVSSSVQNVIDISNLDYHEDKGPWTKYGVSKAGNILHAAEYARRVNADNILSVSLDPGNISTPLYRHAPKLVQFFLKNVVLKPAIYGAYTELFAGLSPDVKMQHTGQFIQPFGKLGTPCKDIEISCKAKNDGGNGIAEEFYDWTEEQVKPFL